jgi:hypothetical protein
MQRIITGAFPFGSSGNSCAGKQTPACRTGSTGVAPFAGHRLELGRAERRQRVSVISALASRPWILGPSCLTDRGNVDGCTIVAGIGTFYGRSCLTGPTF